MAVDWQDLESFAKSFSRDVSALDAPSECHLRACANRFYYSAFHSAQNIADQVPDILGPKNDSVHKALIERFTEYPAMAIPKHGSQLYSQVKKLGLILNALRGLRVAADYYLDDDFDFAKYELCCSEYGRYQETADNLFKLISGSSETA